MSRLDKTLADYVAIAISPALIMAMVGSLMWFLVAVFYVGGFEGRIYWILACFVFAIVLIARIAIEESQERAMVFALPLAGAVGLATMKFSDGVFLHWILLAVAWWSSHKLTWDCTLIDEDQDSTGQGLLQFVGFGKKPPEAENGEGQTDGEKKDEAEPRGVTDRVERMREEAHPKRKTQGKAHAPGVWIVYFSLAALPLFGLGQMFIPAADAGQRLWAFQLLCVYVASGLGLLVTTSFLGLRRYLRQRGVQMPPRMAGVWIALGAAIIVVLLVVCAILPRPAAEYSVAQLPDFPLKFDTPERTSNRHAMGKEGADENDPDSQSRTQGEQDGTKPEGGKSDEPESGGSEGSKGKEGSGKESGGKSQGGSNGDQQQGKSDSQQESSSGKQDSSGQQNQDSEQGEQSSRSQGDQSEQQGGKQGDSRQSESDEQPQDGGEQSQSSGNQQRSSGEQNESQQESDESQSQQESESDRSRESRSGSRGPEQQQNERREEESEEPEDSEEEESEPSGSSSEQSSDQSFQMPEVSLSGGLMGLLKFLVFVVLGCVAAYWAWKNRGALLAGLRQLLQELRDFWARLFGGGPKAAAEEDGEEKPKKRAERPFADYVDPFAAGITARYTADELVRYTFEAAEAWARENGCDRQPDQTPHEFAARLGGHAGSLRVGAMGLARLYCQAAYAPGSLPPKSLKPLAEFWRRLKASHRLAGQPKAVETPAEY